MSAKLSESDLNDFIGPQVACVKPTRTLHTADEGDEALEVGKEPQEATKVSISLQDCLACAGCITSSEEILLSRQSHGVFLEAWRSLAPKALAVSVAPQSRLSLAQHFGLSVAELDQCLSGVLGSYFGAKYVVGTQLGRELSVQQTNARLVERKQQGVQGPLLCSVCPGFVLYAEKTKPGLVPYMLDVKSPQQITGALLHAADPNIYHLSLMPCFDKKLEAAREDCAREVDCVLTPREFVTLLDELQLDLHSFAGAAVPIAQLTPPGWDPRVSWCSSAGSSSGGYAYQYILHMQRLHPGSTIATQAGRNADLLEHRLLAPSGVLLASAGELYGFRNIQNLVRKLLSPATKRSAKVVRRRLPQASPAPPATDPCNADFIEVMACPSGCINGGGLLNGGLGPSQRRDLVSQLNEGYARLPTLDIPMPTYSQPSYIYNLRPLAPTDDVLTVANAW
ncbi:FABL205Cp [Eremothecium gossypii FDAG1]|nr:FABL205Cp [Eremothecium gossypii FDAG1]